MFGVNRTVRRLRRSPLGAPAGVATKSLRQLRLSIRRYVLVSGGIAFTALGLALVISSLAVAYAEPNRLATAAGEPANVAEAHVSSSFFEVAFARYEPPPAGPAAPPRVQLPSRDSVSVTGRINNVNITFYDCLNQNFCGNMYNGRRVYEGAAACSWNLAIGTRFVIVGDPTGRVYTCEDRGLLVNTWVDIFWNDPADGYRWQSMVGRYGSIEIVEAH